MTTTEIQAIPTQHKGVAFRSRLEARYAIFFDALGIEWQYEPRKIHLNTGINYIPDFLILKSPFWDTTQPAFWLEVKPTLDFVQRWKSRAFARTDLPSLEHPFGARPEYYIADQTFRFHQVRTRVPDEMWFEELTIMRTKTGRTWMNRNIRQYGKPLDISRAIQLARSARFEA